MDLTTTSNMTCSSSYSLASSEESPETRASGTDVQLVRPARKRRHSNFIPRRKSIVKNFMEGEEALVLKVCALALEITE